MYSKVILFCSSILLTLNASGLVSTYTFSQNAGTYTAISGGTVLGDTTNNDDNFASLNIGFAFYFNGQSYTQFGVNANGYIAFSNLGFSSNTVISANIGGTNNVISALNYNLQGQTGSVLQYQTSGSAPNRTLVVQWTNYKASAATGDALNFQIRLTETTNAIDVKYGSCVSSTPHTAQIGLRGNSNTDFNNLYVADTAITNTWATSAAGTLNTRNCIIKTGFVPASGQTYSWVPVVPAVPITMTFTGVGVTNMTVNWIDNSTNDTSFLVYKSTDNVNFTLAGTIPSTTKGTTGTAYSLQFTGLITGQLYYYRVYSMDNVPSSTYLSGSQATLTGTLCGTLKIGPAQTYLTIKSAITAIQTNGISCPVILELKNNYVSSVETFPIVIPFLGCSSTNTLTLRPETGAVNRIIGSDSVQTIDLYGATWFTIDGRAGGTGTTINLSIIDSLSTGNAIRFANDAQNNTLNYLSLKGAAVGNSTNGVVRFFNGATTVGNSNNTISNCDISKSNSFPQVLLYSNTNIGFNANNTIINNTFHDWFVDASGNTANNYGINLGAGNTGWTISNNSFFQTAPQVYAISANTQVAINISGGAGNGFTISGNFIGGSGPNCAGTWTINHTGTGSPRFSGISINADTVTATEVQGNTVKNITLSTASTTGNAIFNGIVTSGGFINIGTSTPNTIGSTSGSNSIVTTASGNGVQTVGISTSSSHNVSIIGNTIAGILATDSAAGTNTSLLGILASAGNVAIRNNIIGGSGQSNSLMNAPGDSTGNSFVTGISVSGNNTTSQITGNFIRNLTNQYIGTSLLGITRGISTTGGVNTISANLIENITSNARQTGTSVSASIQGISQASTASGQTVSNNIIRLLSNKSTTNSVVVTGIYYTGSSNGTNLIEKNRIYGLGAPLDTSIAFINGIEVTNGKVLIDNNMISIGTDTLGASNTAAHEYTGILKNGNGNNNIHFNSVNVSGGSVVSRQVNTFAFKRSVTGIDTLLNNIFANTRSNATTGGSHYSIFFNDTLTIKSDRNDLFGNGNGFITGSVNGVNQSSLFNWFSATKTDSNSLAVNPFFQSNVNLHINNPSGSSLESGGIAISSITSDIDGQARPDVAGATHGGASAPDIGADEFDGFPLTIDMGTYALVKPGTGCHTATDSVTVSIKNFSSLPINFALNPCSLYVWTTGTNPVTFPVKYVNTGTLAAGAVTTVPITTYNMSTIGSYVFHAATTTTGDGFSSNDTLAPVTIDIFGGTVTPTSATICPGLSVTIALTGQTPGATIQWQSSTNGTTFTPIVGATNATLTVSPGVKTYYQTKTCSLYFSAIDTVNIASVTAPTTTAAAPRCGVGPVTVHAAGANPIAWFDSLSGGSVVDTGLALTQTVSASGSFYASAIGNVSTQKNLTTTFAQTINNGGNMFAITAINNVIITGFDGHGVAGTNTWGIYYRKDNFLNTPGSNLSSNGWIFVDSVSNVVSAGLGLPTTIPINISIAIPAGKTYSFYVMVFTGNNVYYSVGTGLGNVNTSNIDLQVKDGYAGQTFNCTGNPRVFNGIVHYKTNCFSNRVAANYTVTAPPAINAASSSATICDGDSVQLTGTSANTNYDYFWSPTATLNDSIGNSVWAHPAANTVYHLQAFDSTTSCSNLDSVLIAWNPIPVFNASTTTNSICNGDTVHLNSNLQLSFSFGTGNNSNDSVTYPAPYGNSSFGARHQVLVLASEMTGAGMVKGYINSLTFDVTNLHGVGALTNFTLKIGNTNVTTLTDSFQTTPLSTVFTSASYAPILGINMHAFTTPFYWNGTSNILLETCFNNTTSTYNASTRRSTTFFNSCTYFHRDTTNNCSQDTGTAINRRPNMRFGIRNQYAIQWLSSSQHVSDSLLANAYSIPTASALFQVNVTDTITGCQNKDSIQVSVQPPPVVALGIDTATCGPLVLHAGNPGDTYLWNDSTTSQNLTVDTTGTYSVRVTHLQSCSSYDTIHVTINSLPVVTLALPYDSVCTGDGTRVLSGGTPANGIFSGTGVTGTNFNPVTAGAGFHTIGYTYLNTGTGCSNTATDSVYVDVCASVKGISNDGLVSVYPNPMNKEVTIDLGKIKETCKVELLTPETKVLSTWILKGGTSYPAQMGDYANGVYYLKISTPTSNYLIRLIKQN